MNEVGTSAIRMLVLAVHPSSAAATRLRAVQFRRFFEAEGIDVALWTFLAEDDLADWYGASNVRRSRVLVRALPRLLKALRAIRSADVVLVQREAVPFGPPLLESYAKRRGPVVW